jgi:hypothetical protein
MNDAQVALGPLTAALSAVSALGLSNDLVESAHAKVKRLEAMAKAEAALQAAIASGAADSLSSALAEARECGLDSPFVAKADEALAGLGAQAAMLSKLGSAVHNLEELDAAIAEATTMGGLDDAIATANTAREHLVSQQSVLDSCKGAIAEGRYPALKAAMKRATECGLDTNPTRAGEWSEVVAELRSFKNNQKRKMPWQRLSPPITRIPSRRLSKSRKHAAQWIRRKERWRFPC